MVTKILVNIIKVLRFAFLSLGILFALIVLLAFTSVPFYMHYNLGKNPDGVEIAEDYCPKNIIMFGGAGMPSADNLMRLYYTSSYANHYDTPVILIHPEDSVCQSEMTKYLRQNGIEQIVYMTKGTNTRSQVVEFKELYPEMMTEPMLVVTSTEHMYRTIRCLKKVGFENVIGKPAQEATVDFDLSVEQQNLGGKELIPTVGNTKIRYTFYNYLKLEITCFREYIAIMYYKIKGWI